jgi:hypothetical protein
MSFSVRNPNSFNFSDLTANLKYLQPVAVGAGANATQGASIVLNASGSPLSALANQAFYVSPVRNQTSSNFLFYNTSSKEVSHGTYSQFFPGSVFGQYLSWNGSAWVINGALQVNIGANAGQSNQGLNAVALGSGAGRTNQAVGAIGIGPSAGGNGQGINAVALGSGAGTFNQSTSAVAIGQNAGTANQGQQAIAIGLNSGQTGQGVDAVAIGNTAGNTNQGQGAIAIGNNAGQTNQAGGAIGIGPFAGGNGQGVNAVALGSGAASAGQGSSAVAIGQNAGAANQGQYSIAIGLNAAPANQPGASICLNATSVAVNPATSGFYVSPVRAGQTGTGLVLTAGGEIAQTSSSLRYKENIVDLQKDTSKIFQLQAKSFDLKSGAKNRLGYIAEEVFEIEPSFVILNNESEPEALEEFHMFVSLLEEVKKLKARLDALEAPAPAPEAPAPAQ